MEQDIANCHAVYDVATYKKRRGVCRNQEVQCEQATLHSDSTLHCKENEAMKQNADVNYILNEIQELSQILGDFMFVDSCKTQ